MKLIKLVIYSFITVLSSCVFVHGKEVFKYFELEPLSCIENIIYSDKKALNNVIIEIEDGNTFVHILCVPFTLHEYEKSLSGRLVRGKLEITGKPITLEMSGRELGASKRLLDHGNCYIGWNDYYEGIAFFLSYFGNCDTTKYLDDILAGIRYRISKEKVRGARRDFLFVMSLIEKLDIPIYHNSHNIERKYSLVGLGRSIGYDTEIEAYSTQVLDFYKEYFSKAGWRPYKTEHLGNWHHDKLSYTWIDRDGEMIARLLLSQVDNKAAQLSKQSVYIDISPYLVMEWGRRTVKQRQRKPPTTK